MIKIDPAKTGPALQAPWKNCISVGRAYELLRKDTLDHLSAAQNKLKYNYCRFHGIFHDDMAVVRRRPDGSLAVQWHQVDKVYDALLAMGLRPFVELNPMPAELASGSQTIFEWRMNVSPPKQWEEWGELIRAFTLHLVSRYGIAEVRQWYFEVWNEPNLQGFWSGTKEEYWRLYEISAREIKKIDSTLRVGGPASSKGSWVTDLINHCADGDIPLDFVSTHYYPQDVYNKLGGEPGPPEEGGDFFIRRVKEIKAEVQASRRPELELHFTEWNTLYAESPEGVSWTRNSSVDACFGAPLIVRICTELDAAVDTLCYWIASDVFEEAGLPHSAFDSTYGYTNIYGHPKAHFHAFEFLSRMTGPRLQVESSSPIPGHGTAVATADGGTIRVLLAFDRPAAPGGAWKDKLHLRWNGSEPPVIITSRIAPGSGSAFETWVRLGRPQNLTTATEQLLRAHSQPTVDLVVSTPAHGEIQVPFELEGGEVLLLEIEPREPVALNKGRSKAEVEKWNQSMNDPSRK